MHHKFILFGNEYNSSTPEPFDLLWTGSYNITKNATHSLENGIFIKNAEIIEAYRQEWRQVLLSSVRVQDKWWDKEYSWSDAEDCGIRDGT
jgi:phosphatidylserine/phosphatidylglycerophosphate/cardiolipin synthase-like enzyme